MVNHWHALIIGCFFFSLTTALGPDLSFSWKRYMLPKHTFASCYAHFGSGQQQDVYEQHYTHLVRGKGQSRTKRSRQSFTLGFYGLNPKPFCTPCNKRGVADLRFSSSNGNVFFWHTIWTQTQPNVSVTSRIWCVHMMDGHVSSKCMHLDEKILVLPVMEVSSLNLQ
jgi:hypothetical protein